MIKEEIAFYDALASHETAERVLGDDTLKIIAHELTKSIQDNMSIDWNLRESARAKMRVTVKRLLKSMVIHRTSKRMPLKSLLNKQN